MRRVLESPAVYRLWQAPFVAQKVAAFRRLNPDIHLQRVLDVGCGPGTNAGIFTPDRYLGVDLEPRYIEMARARYGDRFRVADAAALELTDEAPFDCLFVNSLLHHLDDAGVRRLLSRADLLVPGGRLHVIDLHVPDGRGLPRSLALADRGEHPRSLAHLRGLIAEQWTIDVEEPFHLRLLGVPLWAMVYFRATPREA